MKDNYLTKQKFADLGLQPEVITATESLGFTYCTPIQELALPILLQNKDIAGQAQTGTGKTLAFLVAMFNYLLTHPKSNTTARAIIMAPTRELAIQIANDAKAFAEQSKLGIALLYGGEGYDEQIKSLANADIIIGTTGRIIDFINQKLLDLSAIQVTVLDEADRMFDLGFIKDIRFIFKKMPDAKLRLNMLFSATLSMKVQELAYYYMNEPVKIAIEPETKTSNNVEEELFQPSINDKMPLLLSLLEEDWPDKAIIFANTKQCCENLFAWLLGDGHRVGLLTGDVAQNRRIKILNDFTKGSLDVLVATDVAARGLHIPDVSHVYNYDLPDDCEDYVHRIGRTGRAGSQGKSISFACEKYALNLPAIEEYIKHQIPVTEYDSSALLTDIRPIFKTKSKTQLRANHKDRHNSRVYKRK